METIRALMRGDLPPVGNPICIASNAANIGATLTPDYDEFWVDSGTSALGLAFASAKKSRPEIAQPEVILPGYGCPDLVAAAHYAGVKPIVVDISENDPSLDFHSLKNALNPNTIAVVALNFLGVRENDEAFIRLKRDYPALLIVEDNAQWFPDLPDMPSLFGDFVIFSFGRGKPVSLLGGGLLLAKKNKADIEFISSHIESAITPSTTKRVISLAKFLAYNLLLKPQCYQLLSRNPFITLGQTIYHPLEHVGEMDALRISLVASNMQQYRTRTTWVEQAYDELFLTREGDNCFVPLKTSRRKRLLRYPLLFNTVEQKQRYYPQLVSSGLGATEMYRTALPDVEGVRDKIVVSGGLTNAKSFASRFVTLPVHGGVTPRHLDLLKRVLQSS